MKQLNWGVSEYSCSWKFAISFTVLFNQIVKTSWKFSYYFLGSKKIFYKYQILKKKKKFTHNQFNLSLQSSFSLHRNTIFHFVALRMNQSASSIYLLSICEAMKNHVYCLPCFCCVIRQALPEGKLSLRLLSKRGFPLGMNMSLHWYWISLDD